MDSITQAALGAAVGVAVMGRRRPAWQAALAGAVVGTLPDLDVFIDEGDPVRNMVFHRAETHSFFWQTIAAPVIAGIVALTSRSTGLFLRWWVMVLLVLYTHTLLDAMTIYGTQLALPFSDYPVGLGSLFIIDPLYTLPLLAGLLLTMVFRKENRRRWNTAGLVASSAYALWAIAAQIHVTDVARSAVDAQHLPVDRILVTPTPFNTLLWRIVLVTENHYQEGFYSVLDPLTSPGRKLRFDRFERGGELERATQDFTSANLIRNFSKGFYALSDDGRYVRITDLRMGQHPYYAFEFAFAEHHSEPLLAFGPTRTTKRMPLGPGIRWLGRRIAGEDVAPPP